MLDAAANSESRRSHLLRADEASSQPADVLGSGDEPHITLVVPVYGKAEHVDEFLKSVDAQTVPFREVLLVDDDCRDPAIDVLLDSFCDRESRRKITLTTPQGIVVASNLGAEQATMPFVAFADCDDILLPQANERMLAALDGNRACHFLFSKYATFTENPSEHRDPGLFDLRSFYTSDQHLVLEHMFASHLKVFQRAWFLDVGGFPIDSDGIQDWCIATAAIKAGRYVAVSECLYLHRLHPSQTTNSNRAGFFHELNRRRRLSLQGGARKLDLRAERQISLVGGGLSNRSTHGYMLPPHLIASSPSGLSVRPFSPQLLDHMASAGIFDWVMLSGNGWVHLGVASAFVQDFGPRPPIGVAADIRAEASVFLTRWYSGYLDFVLVVDPVAEAALMGYLPDHVRVIQPSAPPREEIRPCD